MLPSEKILNLPRFANVGVQYIDRLHFEKMLLENDISIIIFNEEIKI
jgi:hypothetical protein